MPDREKVMSWLECLAEPDWRDFHSDSEVQNIAKSALALLKRMCDKYGVPFYPNYGMGEDTTFCLRALESGEKLYCDSRVKCGHIGSRIIDEGTYMFGEHP